MRVLGVILLAIVGLSAAGQSPVVYRVNPHDTDPAITRFVEPHYVAFSRTVSPSADLLIFLSGSGGTPTGAIDFLTTGVAQGYRVISLAYNDTPAVVQVCGPAMDAGCSAAVREKRLFGNNTTDRIDDTPAEAIVNRLTKLLIALDRDHPDEHWGEYLDRGAPRWERIAVSGHSQGAGMAAFVAQRHLVARAILISSPWDFYGRDQQLAPWILKGAGVTPSDRWFAAYHKDENTAALIARAYQALHVPRDHVRVFTLEPAVRNGANPFHLSMVGRGATPRTGDGSPAYADNWRFLLGTSR